MDAEFEYEDGSKIVFKSRGGKAGLSDIGADNTKQTKKGKLEETLGNITRLIDPIENAINSLKKKPDEVEVELSISVEGDYNLYVFSGKADGQIKLKLKWDNSDK